MFPERYTVTAALPYANGPLHIGHVAGCYLPADTYVRYLRALGKKVLFICGSDEHGVAITIKARNEGITPQQLVDRYHLLMKKAFEDFDVQFDYYGRTSSPQHHHEAAGFFKKLYEKGVFEEKETEQYYDEEAGQFLADRYISGTCPVCKYEKAYGDQCESCGSDLNPTDLINPVSNISGKPPVLRKTVNWFLPMDKLGDTPEFKEYLKRIEHWKPNVRGQVKSWLDMGLKPRSMTRDIDWGVPVPLPEAKGKVLYVWFDAPIGYISATREYYENVPPAERKPAADAPDWQTWWKDESSALIHFIGKDNIVFHSIIFPIILQQHGGFILPTQVPANEFLNLQEKKLSTSRGWAVWLHEYLENFPGRGDELRYVLTSIAPETKDSDFSWTDYQTRVNSELVAIFGNLVQRTMVLCHKFYEGKMPAAKGELLTEKRSALWQQVNRHLEAIDDAIMNYRFRDGLVEFMNIARAGNKFLAETEPWKSIKTNPEETSQSLWECLGICNTLRAYAGIFLPGAAKALAEMLNIHSTGAFLHDFLPFDGVEAGKTLGEARHLYKPVGDEEIAREITRLETIEKTMNQPETPAKEETPLIDYDHFAKMELKVGIIKTAEKVEKADKLLQLSVDMGDEVRTILSGMAQHFSPEDLIGKQVCVVANLAPRKIRGIESKGMILMAEDADGKLVMVSPTEAVKAGSKVS